MNAANLKLAPSLEEQRFLNWFAADFQGKGLESVFQFDLVSSYCTSFSEKFGGREIAGHGYDRDPSMAALKGAAELIERRLVIEFFRRHPKEILHNTNGFAVHLSRASAVVAARREALERHVLLYSYLRSGWDDFILLDRRVSREGQALFIVAPFTQNGYFAGMVVYQDFRFPGVSFGYLADEVARIQDSPRWNHALFEAVGFVERGLETGGFLGDSENSLYNACKSWLLGQWQEPKWKMSLQLSALSEIEIGIQAGSVAELTPCCEGLHYARVLPGNLIPLYAEVDEADSGRVEYIETILSRHGVGFSEQKVPVL